MQPITMYLLLYTGDYCSIQTVTSFWAILPGQLFIAEPGSTVMKAVSSLLLKGLLFIITRF